MHTNVKWDYDYENLEYKLQESIYNFFISNDFFAVCLISKPRQIWHTVIEMCWTTGQNRTWSYFLRSLFFLFPNENLKSLSAAPLHCIAVLCRDKLRPKTTEKNSQIGNCIN